ncbi:MAG: glycosyltransferase family 39 protein [Kiritimatiellae bacterium]|nr:glycosyltransferase family 39 protein [Kiritimatiellia bacterium]MDD5522848.1 glycosyltransferase family 39 protein [Kiritimatiellia bacterium]
MSVLTLFSVLSVFLTIPSEGRYRIAADEGSYYFYASSVGKYGPSMIADIGRAYVRSDKAKLQPSPLRVGHILAITFWLKIFPTTYVSLARFSFFCFVLFLLCSFYFSRRHFGEDVAYIFTMLLSVSPLMMAMGRRALSDMHGNLWCGLVIWLFLDFLRYKKRFSFYLLLFAYSFSILSRESLMTLYPFLVIMFLVSKYVYKNELPLSYLAGIILIPVVVVGLVYVLFFGGVHGAWNIVSAVFIIHGNVAATTSQYALSYSSGPWFRYLIDFIVLSPWTFLLFLGFVGHKLISRDCEWRTVYFAGYFVTMLFIFTGVLYFKDVRFLINLDMVIVLFSAMYLLELFRQSKTEYQMRLVLISAVIIFFVNYVTFSEIFCVQDVYDPVSYDLLSAMKIIP